MLASETMRVQYDGNGVTTVFSFPYKFFANGDVVVILTDSFGTDTPQVITTDYTLTGAGGESGGNVTMLTPPASGERLTVYRNVDVTQETDFTNQQLTYMEAFEARADYLTMIDQQLKEELSRCAKNSVVDGPTSLTLKDLANFSGYPSIIINSMAALILLDTSSVVKARMLGFYSVDDEGGGLYYWDSTVDADTHNGGTIIDPSIGVTPGAATWWTPRVTTDKGVWIRTESEKVIRPAWFGMSSSSTAAVNTAAFQAALDSYTSGFITIELPSGQCEINEITHTISSTKGLKLYAPSFNGAELLYNGSGVGITITGSGNAVHHFECENIYMHSTLIDAGNILMGLDSFSSPRIIHSRFRHTGNTSRAANGAGMKLSTNTKGMFYGYFEQCEFYGAYYGLDARQDLVTTYEITDMRFFDCRFGNVNHCVQVGQAGKETHTGWNFFGCSFENYAMVGVVMYGRMNTLIGSRHEIATNQTVGEDFIVGRYYKITNYVAGDDFTNIGASANETGVKFTATGTTPTTWTNGSTIRHRFNNVRTSSITADLAPYYLGYTGSTTNKNIIMDNRLLPIVPVSKSVYSEVLGFHYTDGSADSLNALTIQSNATTTGPLQLKAYPKLLVVEADNGGELLANRTYGVEVWGAGANFANVTDGVAPAAAGDQFTTKDLDEGDSDLTPTAWGTATSVFLVQTADLLQAKDTSDNIVTKINEDGTLTYESTDSENQGGVGIFDCFGTVQLKAMENADRWTVETSGSLVIGERYYIKDWKTGDDFTNVGGLNSDRNYFTATGTTPTDWSNSSVLYHEDGAGTGSVIYAEDYSYISIVITGGTTDIIDIITDYDQMLYVTGNGSATLLNRTNGGYFALPESRNFSPRGYDTITLVNAGAYLYCSGVGKNNMDNAEVTFTGTGGSITIGNDQDTRYICNHSGATDVNYITGAYDGMRVRIRALTANTTLKVNVGDNGFLLPSGADVTLAVEDVIELEYVANYTGGARWMTVSLSVN